jgi:hypothetical protein
MMLSWTDTAGAPGSTAMTFIRGAWRATLGPFPTRGNVPWTVTASDAEGNTGSRSGETTVYCPVIG